jgi:hypothetical protein
MHAGTQGQLLTVEGEQSSTAYLLAGLLKLPAQDELIKDQVHLPADRRRQRGQQSS